MKTLFSTFLFSFLFFISLFSQPTLEWESRWNGPTEDDYGKKIAIDKFGNSYVTGVTQGVSSNDIITIKYNPDGDTLWTKIYNGVANGNDEPYAIKVDGNGNVYIVGYSLTLSTGIDCITIKYNTNGLLQWARPYNKSTGTKTDIGYNLTIDAYKNVYVVGVYQYTSSDNRSFALKYDIDGLLKWDKSYSNPDMLTEVEINTFGNLIVGGNVGHIYALDIYELNIENGETIFKYNQWDQNYTYYAKGFLNKLVLDNLGNIYTLSSAHDLGEANTNKLYYCKFNHNQNTVALISWTDFYYGEITGIDLKIDKDKNIFAVADYFNIYHSSYIIKISKDNELLFENIFNSLEDGDNFPVGLTLSNINSDPDFFVGGYNSDGEIQLSKFDSEGIELWTENYDCGSAGTDISHAMVMDKCDNIYITGSSKCDDTGKDIKTIKYSTIENLEIEALEELPICKGDEITLTVPSCTGCTYLWSNSQTTNSITVTPPDTTTFTVIVKYPSGCEITSLPLEIPVVELKIPHVSINASTVNICPEEEVTFIATPLNGGEEPIYEWYVNDELIESSTSDTFSTAELENNSIVKCIMTSVEQCLLVETGTSNEIVITVNPLLPVSLEISPDATEICDGGSATFTATSINGGTDPVYYWYINDELQEGNDSVFTTSSLADGDNIYAEITSNALCPDPATATSDVVEIIVYENLTPIVTIEASENQICIGDSVTFSAFPENEGPTPTFQWFINDVLQAESSDIFVSPPFDDDTYVYCIMTTSEECYTNIADTSNLVSIEVNELLTPVVSIVSSAISICPEEEVTFVATPLNGGEEPLYDWYINDELIESSTSDTFSTTELENNSIVKCVMTSVEQCLLVESDTSNEIVITVNPLLPVSLEISPDATEICEGGSVTFTATSINGGTDPVYHWYINDELQEGIDSVFISSSLYDGDIIYAEITSNALCPDQDTATSDPVQIIVYENLTPIVTIEASENQICKGDSVEFTAYPENEGPTPTFQWFINDVLQVESSDIFVSPPFDDDTYVYCIMTTSEECYTNINDTSNLVSIEVNELLTPVVSIVSSAISICPEEEVTFIASPVNGGEEPLYEWYINDELIESSTSDTFSTTDLENNSIVKCVMTSVEQCLLVESSTSNEIVITVNPLLSVSLQISSSASNICEGEAVTFTAAAINGGEEPVYEWYINDHIQQGNGYQFTTSTLTNGATVHAIVTSNALCPDNARTISNTLTMTVNPKLTPSVSIVSSENSICAGQNVTFTATPVNGGITPVYQWYLNDVLQPVNESTFTTNISNEGSNLVYCIMISNAECITQSTATSNFKSIAVNPLLIPSVTVNASATSVFICEEVFFAAIPSNGGFNPSYRWFINGNQVGTGSSYKSSSLTNGSKIYCEMTSSENCVTASTVNSDTMTLTVSPLPQPLLTLKHDTISIANYTGSKYNYYWYLNGIEISTEPFILCSKYGNGTYYVVVILDNCSVTSGSIAVDCRTATSEADVENKFTIFPNPTDGVVQVEGRTLSMNRLSIVLYNLLGVKLEEKTLIAVGQEINTQFDLNDLANGVYMISISSPTYNKVFMIQKFEKK